MEEFELSWKHFPCCKIIESMFVSVVFAFSLSLSFGGSRCVHQTVSTLRIESILKKNKEIKEGKKEGHGSICLVESKQVWEQDIGGGRECTHRRHH